MQPQIISDLSNEDYHAHPAISKSGLDAINKSALHYEYRYLNPNKPELVWSDALTVGSALHKLVLEPQAFDEEFAVKEKVNGRTKAGKEYNEQFDELNKDKIIIDEQQYNFCINLKNAVQENPIADQYLDGFGSSELSLFWEWSKDLPVPCRCRPDYIREDGVIVDLKSALTANPRVFQRKAYYEFRYHVQAAFYMEGYRACYGKDPKEFVFVVVEKGKPHPVEVFKATPDFIAAGLEEAVQNLKTFWNARQTNVWPGYSNNEVLPLDTPYRERSA